MYDTLYELSMTLSNKTQSLLETYGPDDNAMTLLANSQLLNNLSETLQGYSQQMAEISGVDTPVVVAAGAAVLGLATLGLSYLCCKKPVRPARVTEDSFDYDAIFATEPLETLPKAYIKQTLIQAFLKEHGSEQAPGTSTSYRNLFNSDAQQAMNLILNQLRLPVDGVLKTPADVQAFNQAVDALLPNNGWREGYKK